MSTKQPGADKDDKPLTYSERFKKECCSAASLCLWDRVMKGLKDKEENAQPHDNKWGRSKTKSEMPPGTKGYGDRMNREGFEAQLENQREHYVTKLQEKDELLVHQQTDFEEKLLRTQEDYEQRLLEADNTIEELKRQVRCGTELVPQYEFKVENFSELRKAKERHTTLPMCAKPGGYKFTLEVIPNHGSGSHLSIAAYTEKGENDRSLTFPANITIAVQLMNQHEPTKGYAQMMVCVYKAGAERELLGAIPRLVSFAELDESENAKLYMRKDRLRFRVVAAIVEQLYHTEK